MTNTNEEVAGVGHNNPPSDIEILQMRLAEEYDTVFQRASTLIGAAGRMPEKIEDDETEGKVTDLIGFMTKNMKDIDAGRVKEKAPYLALERAVDGTFNTVSDKVAKAKKSASALLTDYQREKARIARQAELDEAERKRKEAADIAAQAQAQEDAGQAKAATETLNEAASIERQATKHEAAATGKASELTRARGESGSTSSLRTTWKVEITDAKALDLELLRPFISQDALQTAANAYIKTLAKPVTGEPLKGARIFEHTEAVVR